MKKYLFSICFVFLSWVQAQDLYLHCGQLIDTKNEQVLLAKTVVVSGTKIKVILDGYQNPNSSKDQVINLKSYTILPGLIDMHVHLETEYNPNKYMERFTANEADIAFGSVSNAERTLLSGFTTVRDLGGTGVNIALRNAINKGAIVGPRIFTAGKSIATTGGHADPTNGMKKMFMGDPGPEQGVINGVVEAKKAVRQRYKNGADNIKITATGGVLSVAKNGHNPQFTLDEIKAICETAKDYGMIVAAHAHGDEGMRRAVIGGVTTIEHGTMMSLETMDLMIAHGTYYVPTITAGKAVAANAKIKGFYPEIIVPKALEIGPKIQSTFSKAYQRGVPIAFGTDAGVFPHGLNAKEFGFMVEVGMSPMAAIKSATYTNAKVLGLSESLGQISQGFTADIIATFNNPLEDVSVLENVAFVMKDGTIYTSKISD